MHEWRSVWTGSYLGPHAVPSLRVPTHPHLSLVPVTGLRLSWVVEMTLLGAEFWGLGSTVFSGPGPGCHSLILVRRLWGGGPKGVPAPARSPSTAPGCHGPAWLQLCPPGRGASVRVLLNEQ